MTIIEVVLVFALGAHGFTSDGDVLRVWGDVQQIYREEVGIELRLKNYVKRRNPFPKFTTLKKREALLRKWEGYFRRRRNKAVLKFALTPPLTDTGGLFYLAGFANRTCAYKSINPVGYSVGEPVNPNGQARYIHSVYAMAHELGHLLGAEHCWSANGRPQTIMHPAALAFVEAQGGRLYFDRLSVDSIRRCVN